MTKTYRPHPQDAARSRAEATRAGTEAAPSGERATDYFATAAQMSAQTAATLHLAGHLHDERTRRDQAVAQAAALVARLTAWVGDVLVRISAADHEVQAFKRLPLAARREPWPAWLRCLLLVVMALGTGAALSGALLELTSDEPYYVWGFCLATTLAVVALGAFLAHTARSFEYNHLKPDQFTTGWLPKVIGVVGALFAVLLMVALASIRGTAAQADAARQNRTDDGITVLLPDQPIDAGQATPTEEPPPLPSVSPVAFGLLEGLLFVGAFGVEYINFLPWAEQRRQANARLARVEGERRSQTLQLGDACGRLMAELAGRADRDAAVLLTGEATITHVAAEVSDYRRAVVVHQPNPSGDPFSGVGDAGRLLAASPSDKPLSVKLAARWGRDLLPSGLIHPDVAYDHLEFDQLAPTVLARGLAMLATVPERASFTGVNWSPSEFVDGALQSADGAAPTIGVKASGGNGNETKARP